MLEDPILIGIARHVRTLIDFQQVDVEGGIQEEVTAKELLFGIRAYVW